MYDRIASLQMELKALESLWGNCSIDREGLNKENKRNEAFLKEAMKIMKSLMDELAEMKTDYILVKKQGTIWNVNPIPCTICNVNHR